jgi:hypothetical protein
MASAAPSMLPFEEILHSSCKEFGEALNHARTHEVILGRKELKQVAALSHKLKMTKKVVGFGNFNLLGVDEMLYIGRNYSKVGNFTKADMDLFESLFYQKAEHYGFFGEKVLTSITDDINKKETYKVPYTGHYVYKGQPLAMYEKIRREVGDSVVLTSGVRSIVKQMDLFLAKVVRSRGNVSVASRSLAPAGYSYHAIGDFDVGKRGFGYRNFTSDFSKTDEYKKLIDTGYVKIRYTKDNPFGVRFEPWHIKVV